MDLLAIVALAGLLLVKEAGVPVPVPGDLLVIGAGVALAGDPPLAVAALLAILLVGYVGGTVQYALARRVLRRPLIATLVRFGVSEARIEMLASRLRRSGARGVAIARMTPGLRIAAIAAAGVAAIPFAAFLAGLVAGNGIFVAAHFALGYLLGASATGIIERTGGFGLIAVVLVILAVVGAVGWLAVRRAKGGPGGYGDWADASCPACLSLAVVSASDSRTDRPEVRP